MFPLTRWPVGTFLPSFLPSFLPACLPSFWVASEHRPFQRVAFSRVLFLLAFLYTHEIEVPSERDEPPMSVQFAAQLAASRPALLGPGLPLPTGLAKELSPEEAPKENQREWKLFSLESERTEPVLGWCSRETEKRETRQS